MIVDEGPGGETYDNRDQPLVLVFRRKRYTKAAALLKVEAIAILAHQLRARKEHHLQWAIAIQMMK